MSSISNISALLNLGGSTTSALGLNQNTSFGSDAVAGLFNFNMPTQNAGTDVFSLAFGLPNASSTNLLSQVFGQSTAASVKPSISSKASDIEGVVAALIAQALKASLGGGSDEEEDESVASATSSTSSTSTSSTAQPASTSSSSTSSTTASNSSSTTSTTASNSTSSTTAASTTTAQPTTTSTSQTTSSTSGTVTKIVNVLPDSSVDVSDPELIKCYSTSKNPDGTVNLSLLAQKFKDMGLSDQKATNVARVIATEERAREISLGWAMHVNDDADLKLFANTKLDVKKPGDRFTLIAAAYTQAGGKFNLGDLKTLLQSRGVSGLSDQVGKDEIATLNAVKSAIDRGLLSMDDVLKTQFTKDSDASKLFGKATKYIDDRHFGSDLNKVNTGAKAKDLTTLASVSDGVTATSYPEVKPIQKTITEKVAKPKPPTPAKPKPTKPQPQPKPTKPAKEPDFLDKLLSILEKMLPMLLLSQLFNGGASAPPTPAPPPIMMPMPFGLPGAPTGLSNSNPFTSGGIFKSILG